VTTAGILLFSTVLTQAPWTITPTDTVLRPQERIYRQLLEGVGQQSPDWHRLTVVAESIIELEKVKGQGVVFSRENIESAVSQKLIDQGLPFESAEHFDLLLGQLAEAGVIAKRGKQDVYTLLVSPEVVAVKFKLVYNTEDKLRPLIDAW